MVKKAKKSYCSWCFQNTAHRLIEENAFTRDDYKCSNCNNETVTCHANGCMNMAEGSDPEASSTSGIQSLVGSVPDLFCAEHNGTIASFEGLTTKLSDIQYFDQIFLSRKTNWSTYTKMVSAVAGGAILTSPLSYWALPAVASHLGASGLLGNALTGRLITLLSGAALQSASVAALGTQGMAAIVAIGAGLGGINGGIISNAYLRELDSFSIRCLKPGKEPGVIFINGFLTENDFDCADWIHGVKGEFSENAWYHICWDAGTQNELGSKIFKPSRAAISQLVVKHSSAPISRVLNKMSPADWATLPADFLTNPWFRALNNTVKAGSLIADIISRTDKQYIIMGHSLGARISRYVLEALSTKEGNWIDSAFLLGGAVDRNAKDEWKLASQAVSKKLYNCYSSRDHVLSKLYKSVTLLRGEPIGISPIMIRNGKFRNINCSDFVNGHFDWKNNLDKIIKIAQIESKNKNVIKKDL